MPPKMALVDFNQCHPDECPDGVCAAVTACPRQLLRQDTPFKTPMPNPSLCKGCGDCARACPLDAISVRGG